MISSYYGKTLKFEVTISCLTYLGVQGAKFFKEFALLRILAIARKFKYQNLFRILRNSKRHASKNLANQILSFSFTCDSCYNYSIILSKSTMRIRIAQQNQITFDPPANHERTDPLLENSPPACSRRPRC